MKTILSIIFILSYSQAHAAIVVEPPQKGVAPRANADGMGHSAPPRNIKSPYPQPVYYENGRPVFANTPSKDCKDKTGNVIKCPETKNDPVKQ